MANYTFIWQTVSANGDIESFHKQTIYGESLSNACEYFEQFHGDIGPDENGVSVKILSVTKEKAPIEYRPYPDINTQPKRQ